MNKNIAIFIVSGLLLGTLVYISVLLKDQNHYKAKLDQQEIELDSLRQELTIKVEQERKNLARAEAVYLKAKHEIDSLAAIKKK